MSRFIRYCFFAVLCLFSGFGAVAGEGYTTNKISLVPSDFYVGDDIELRVSITLDTPGTTLVTPQILPEDQSYSVKDIKISQANDTADITLIVSSYQPGESILPPIDLGGVVITEITLNTGSVLNPETFDLKPLAQPLYAPSTAFYLSITIGILAGGPLLGWFTFKKIRNYIDKLKDIRMERLPYENISKAIQTLNDELLLGDANRFYTTLSGELRQFLSLITGSIFNSYTTCEIKANLNDLFRDKIWAKDLGKILSTSDQVKFGNKAPLVTERQEDLQLVKLCVNNIRTHFQGEV